VDELCDFLDCPLTAVVEGVYHGDPPMTEPVRRLALCSIHNAELSQELVLPGWEWRELQRT
jgi:hypothetical protein